MFLVLLLILADFGSPVLLIHITDISILLLVIGYLESGIIIGSGTLINFGVFLDSGTIILAVLLFDTPEYMSLCGFRGVSRDLAAWPPHLRGETRSVL